jgi:hypothetical protein
MFKLINLRQLIFNSSFYHLSATSKVSKHFSNDKLADTTAKQILAREGTASPVNLSTPSLLESSSPNKQLGTGI